MNEVELLILERKGMWRRAARGWLELQFSPALSDSQREFLRRRCKWCLQKSRKVNDLVI
ncbi:PerC family transcriptional regulator [Scandinavium tedordense]|uniref:PerC family transcriptional regulator n=1 Tax=Scandinavium tedordense TaxID=2926521 RepID=UPI0035AF0E48